MTAERDATDVLRKHRPLFERRAYPSWSCTCDEWDGAEGDNGGPADGANDNGTAHAAHVAAALAAAGLLRARDDEEGGLTLTATDTHDRDAERAAAWERGYKTGYSYRGPFGASAGNPVPDNPYTADGGRP